MVAFDTPIKSNDQSIDRVLSAGLPVVLVFLNGPAPSQLDQAMTAQARENSGKLLLVQIQVKDNPETARRYQVTQTPALITLKNGQTLTRAALINHNDLVKHIAYLLGKGPKPEPDQRSSQRESAQNTYQSPSGAQSHAEPMVVTDATFEQAVLHSAQPVLVDFWAPWCGPCRMTEPILQRLAKEMSGRLNIVKLNVDENPVSAQRYGVQSIPTMMIVKNGQVIDRWVGALPEPAIRSRISPVIH
ncbi:MAG: thioredoxin [Omnitrophica WOR_2 bacterium]